MRVWFAGFIFLALGVIGGVVGCGDKNGGNSNSNVATTPNTYCLQNSGTGCTGYGQVDPRYVQPYPYGPNGYGGGGYYNGCNQYPGQWAPIYGANNGLGCMNMAYAPQPNYWQYPSAYGYGGYQGFTSYCVVTNSYWSNGWSRGGTSCVYGTCRPFQPGGYDGYCSTY